MDSMPIGLTLAKEFQISLTNTGFCLRCHDTELTETIFTIHINMNYFVSISAEARSIIGLFYFPVVTECKSSEV